MDTSLVVWALLFRRNRSVLTDIGYLLREGLSAEHRAFCETKSAGISAVTQDMDLNARDLAPREQAATKYPAVLVMRRISLGGPSPASGDC
jgi:hypothetical protein